MFCNVCLLLFVYFEIFDEIFNDEELRNSILKKEVKCCVYFIFFYIVEEKNDYFFFL